MIAPQMSSVSAASGVKMSAFLGRRGWGVHFVEGGEGPSTPGEQSAPGENSPEGTATRTSSGPSFRYALSSFLALSVLLPDDSEAETDSFSFGFFERSPLPPLLRA